MLSRSPSKHTEKNVFRIPVLRTLNREQTLCGAEQRWRHDDLNESRLDVIDKA